MAAAVAWNKRAAPVVTDAMVENVLSEFVKRQATRPYSASINPHNLECMCAALTAALAADGQGMK